MIFNSTLKQIYIHFQTQGRDFVNFVFSFKKHILTIITITPSPLQLLPPSVSLFHLSPSSSPLFYLYYCHRSYYCCHHRLHYYYCHHYNRDHSHAFWKNFQKVTYSITTQSQTHLTVEFLSDILPKSRYILLVYVMLISFFKSSSTVQSHICIVSRSI